MRLKPKDLKRIATIFHDLTVNKYKLYAIRVNGVHDIDLTAKTKDGLDELIHRSLMAAINTVLTDFKPEPLPPNESVKLITYSGKGKNFSPYSNDYLWGIQPKTSQ